MAAVCLLVYFLLPDMRGVLFKWVLPASTAIVLFKLKRLSKDKNEENRIHDGNESLSLYKGDRFITKVLWSVVTQATFRTVLGIPFIDVFGTTVEIILYVTYISFISIVP